MEDFKNDGDLESPSAEGEKNFPKLQNIAQEIMEKKLTPKLYPVVKLMQQRNKEEAEAIEEGDDKKNARNNPSSERWKRLEKNQMPEFVRQKKDTMKSYRVNFIPTLDETQELRDKYQECSNFEDAFFEFQIDPYKGAVYQGQWLKGKRHGLGTMFWMNDVVYNGYWEKDFPSSPGQIVKILEQGRYLTFYSGELSNFMRQGYGEYGHRDLWYGYIYTYKGSWNKDIKNGEGKESFSNELYEGIFVNDRREGQGKCTFRNGYTYEGEWKGGKMHGKGTYKFNDKTYEGEMEFGFMKGQGKLTDSSKNRVYEGSFLQDAFHGQGKMTWDDGRYYDGNWDFGVQDGDGEFKFPDGTVKKGTWQNGKLESNYMDFE